MSKVAFTPVNVLAPRKPTKRICLYDSIDYHACLETVYVFPFIMTIRVRNNSEQTPLLPSPDRPVRRVTPLPKAQLGLALFVRLTEPIALTCIIPFVNEAIYRDPTRHIPHAEVGYYSGLVESAFSLTQAITILYWGRQSDRYGRKPITLIGLFGASISVLAFGFSRTFWQMLCARSICGILYGNSGVIKCIVAELTDETNEAIAFGLLPLVYAIGTFLGPLLGGFLANPTERFPSLSRIDLLIRYPYLLSCAVCAAFPLIGAILAMLFFEETLQREPIKVPSTEQPSTGFKQPAAPEPISLKALLSSRRVLVTLINYAALAFMASCLVNLLPLFMFTPYKDGGLFMTPSETGSAIAAQSACAITAQIFFPVLHNRLGSAKLFQVMVPLYPVGIVLLPLSNFAARVADIKLAYTILGASLLFMALGNTVFSANMLLINASAPTRNALGTLNGLSQTVASGMRAAAPAVANALFALSSASHIAGGQLVWICLFLVGLGTCWTSWQLEDGPAAWRLAEELKRQAQEA